MSESERSIIESHYEEIIILTEAPCEDNLLSGYINEEHVMSDIIINENHMDGEHLELEPIHEVTIIQEEELEEERLTVKKTRKRKHETQPEETGEKKKTPAPAKRKKIISDTTNDNEHYQSPNTLKTDNEEKVSSRKAIQTKTADENKQPARSMPEVMKMKQGMTYSAKEKIIILNVYKYFRLEAPETCVRELVRRTALATGCSEKSIFKFRKEEEFAGGCKEPSRRKKRTGVNINSRDFKYNENVRDIIKTIIDDLQEANIMPTLNRIARHCKEHDVPDFSTTTLRRLMMDMGFFYIKNGNQSLLVQKPEYNKYVNTALSTLKENRNGKRRGKRKETIVKINLKAPKQLSETKARSNKDTISSSTNRKKSVVGDGVEIVHSSYQTDLENAMLHAEYQHEDEEGVETHQKCIAIDDFAENVEEEELIDDNSNESPDPIKQEELELNKPVVSEDFHVINIKQTPATSITEKIMCIQ